MNIILNWKYESIGNDVLDYIASVDFDSQDMIARDLGINPKTLRRRIAKLKEDGSLVIYRYENNNFIYCIGDDAKRGWNSYQCMEIAKHRKLELLCMAHGVDMDEWEDDDMVYALEEVVLFEDEEEKLSKDMGYSDNDRYPTSGYAQALEFSRAESKELNSTIDGLVDGWRSYRR